MESVELKRQVDALMFGTEFGDDTLKATMARELEERLAEAADEQRPLRVYAGYDPSAPDLHIGHAITLRRLRMFQDLGHDVTFVIGTFTAQVGDTSDKTSGRPRKTPEEVMAAARSYEEQSYIILDRQRTTVARNADWLDRLRFADVIELASKFTVQQFLARHNYRQRIESGNPVSLHEFMYALMQGYDAVELRADVQLGATEQLFNIMAGRKLQEAFGQRGCICLTFPILVGTDGKDRMSKSKGNTIGIAEPPREQYGKTMSVSDDTMVEFIKYATRWSTGDIEHTIARVRDGSLHPMEVKKRVAWEIVATYHGPEAADGAQEHFESLHQRRETPGDAVEIGVTSPTDIVSFLHDHRITSSRGQARRLVEGGGVRIDGTVARDFDVTVSAGSLVQVGKRRFFRVIDGG